jgi:hypothetical protein
MVKNTSRPHPNKVAALLLEHRREKHSKFQDKYALAQQRIMTRKLRLAKKHGNKNQEVYLETVLEDTTSP